MVRGLTEDGKPKSFRYTLADYWVKDYHNLKIAPYETTLLKLVCPIGEEAKYHFIYLWWWPGKACWLIEGTNYSGTGGRNWETMEEWLTEYKRTWLRHPELENTLIEAEIPYNAWWTILNGLWQLHKQEIKETEQEGYGNG